MDIWTTAKEILLLEEAQSRSANTLAYGLCKPPQFHPHPVELVSIIHPVMRTTSTMPHVSIARVRYQSS